ncbi:hypothetical protein MAH48_15705, partial [Anoxybacillus flavithermus]|nr:hypothetical protein [Anoxybacillus flavithermus]
MSFADLDQNQQANLLYFLDKSDHHELNKLKHKYGVRQGRNAKEFRQNALNNLMTGCIPFDDFMSWLSHIYLEGNNMLFVYEPRNIDLFETNPINKVFNDTKDKIEHLYNINVKTLKEVTLVNVQMDLAKSQLIFTFVSPSQVLVKNDETNSWESQDDIYMSYVIMDYKLKHFVLVMHPTEHLVSVCGIKKKEWDELTWILMKRFRETV